MASDKENTRPQLTVRCRTLNPSKISSTEISAKILLQPWITWMIASQKGLKTNAPDTLLENLNSYHSYIKFTAEENPDHFLDTSFNYQDGHFITRVYQKPGKLQVHWKSAIPERWKRNTILGALHRAKRIATNWKEEVKVIKQSFIKSGYPAKIVNEVIHDFENPRGDPCPLV